MQVIIFDRTNDDRYSANVGVLTAKDESKLEEAFQKNVASGTILEGSAYEIVDDSTLPWDQPRESWEWV